jgi:hypothetical protein
MTHLDGVTAALEPGAGGIAPQLGFLPPCLLASQSLATFPNGSYLFLGPSKAKEGIMREPLGFGSNASSFLLGSSELDSGLREVRVAGHTRGTYGGGSGSSGSKVWWTSNFFSFTFLLTRMAVCLWGV